MDTVGIMEAMDLWETTYRMVLWAYGARNAIDLTLGVSDFLQGFGPSYVPVFLPNGEKLPREPEAMEKEFSYWRAKQSGLLSVWLRSENDMVLDLTVDIPQYPHVRKPEKLAIGFDSKHLEGASPELEFNQLQDIFSFCIKLFKPFYGWCSRGSEISYSEEYKRKIKTVDQEKVPAAIQWFNHFGPNMVRHLGGADALLSAPAYLVQEIDDPAGVILILQKEPFDYRNSAHVTGRRIVEEYLNLAELHKRYSKM